MKLMGLCGKGKHSSKGQVFTTFSRTVSATRLYKPVPEPKETSSTWPALTSLEIKPYDRSPDSKHAPVPTINFRDIFKLIRGSSASLKKFHLRCESIRSPFIEKLVALCPLLEDVSLVIAALYEDDPFFAPFIGVEQVLDHGIIHLGKLKLKELELHFGFSPKRRPCSCCTCCFQHILEEILKPQSLLKRLILKIMGHDIMITPFADLVERVSPDFSQGIIEQSDDCRTGIKLLIDDFGSFGRRFPIRMTYQ